MKKKFHRLLCALGLAAAVTVPIAAVTHDAGPTNTSAIVQATEAVMTTASPALAVLTTADAVVQTDIVQSIVNSTETFAAYAMGLATILGTGFVLLAMQRRRRIGTIGNWLAGMKHRTFAIDTGKTKGWTDDDNSAMRTWAQQHLERVLKAARGPSAKNLVGAT